MQRSQSRWQQGGQKQLRRKDGIDPEIQDYTVFEKALDEI